MSPSRRFALVPVCSVALCLLPVGCSDRAEPDPGSATHGIAAGEGAAADGGSCASPADPREGQPCDASECGAFPATAAAGGLASGSVCYRDVHGTCTWTITGPGDGVDRSACPDATNTCEVDGLVYRVGQALVSSDGCLSCECLGGDMGVGCAQSSRCGQAQPEMEACHAAASDEGQACDPADCGPLVVGVQQPDAGTCRRNIDGLCRWFFFESDGSPRSDLSNSCPATVCEDSGSTYRIGEVWPSSDQCNFCECDSDGSVGCTAALCQ
jgi:hypothetical protein